MPEYSMDSEQRASANRRLTSSAFTTTGSCSASGSCVSSGNYPSSYANYESCTITPRTDGFLSVVAFETYFFDALTVDGAAYSGTSGPDWVAVSSSTSISW